MTLEIQDPASEALIQKRLASGAYATAEAVVRRALEVLDAEERLIDEETRVRLEKQQAALQAGNLVELFANSPFRGLNIEFDKDRRLDHGREIEL